MDLVAIERGGDVTYHGPGQLVVYPIRRLARFREVVPLVRALEGAVIDACARFGVAAERWSGHAGVWVGRNQICAIGLAIQRMASLHGIALNVSTDLGYDRLITPCGLPDRGVTSLAAETGRAVGMGEAKRVLLAELARAFDVDFVPADSGARGVDGDRDRSARAASPRKPDWLRVSLPIGDELRTRQGQGQRRWGCTRSAKRPRARTWRSAGAPAPRRS